MKIISISRKLATALICLIFPARISGYLLRPLGHRICPRAKIGFSLLFAENLSLDETSRVGHFNIVATRRLLLRQGAMIGNFNVLRGPVSVWLEAGSAIGHRNVVTRARRGVTYGPAMLRLGARTKITASHKIDCAASIRFGSYSILAGAASQLWTHGYVHDQAGPGRYRVDGEISIGDNVYLGSRIIVTGGVTIANSVTVGAGGIVSRSLSDPGMYVSASIRRLPIPADPSGRSDLMQIKQAGLVETVYRKRQ